MTDESRKPFSDQIEDQTVAFAQQMLEEHPELHTIAITFNYGPLNENLRNGVVMGQGGPLKTPTEIINTGQQLLRTIHHVFNTGGNYLAAIDAEMARRAENLQKLQEQLNAADNTSPGDTDGY